MKNLLRVVINKFNCLLHFRRKFIINMNVARTQHSNKLFIKYFRLNIVLAALLGFSLFSLRVYWLSEGYAITMSLVGQLCLIGLLIGLNIVLPFIKREKFTKKVKKSTKNITKLSTSVSIVKAIAFNSMLTLMFYTLYVILFDLSAPHSKLLINLTVSCMACTLGAFLMMYIDELVCIAMAIRLYKIGKNL